jgi:hypothetical protein
MCVILLGKADKVAAHITAACNTNPHGNGMAWVETTNQGNSIIKFMKGMSDEKALMMAHSFDPNMDIVFHARISTAGSVSSELCHPFPIERVPSVETEGTADMVLFHNGHFSAWEKYVPEFLVKSEPEMWSDSRAVAHGIAMGFIKMKDLGGKIPGVYAVMSTEPFQDYPEYFGTVRRFGHWTLVKGGVWASNTYFLHTPYTSIYDHLDFRTERKRFARNFYRWEKMYSEYEKELDKELEIENDRAMEFSLSEASEREVSESMKAFDNPDSWIDWERTAD